MRGRVIPGEKIGGSVEAVPLFSRVVIWRFGRYRAARHCRRGSFRNAKSLSVGFARAVVKLGSQLPV
jgi:hypothetical protein